MIKGTDDTRYAFVNGIIRAREAQMINRGQFERLLSAGIESFGAILADTPYSADKNLLNSIAKEETAVRDFFNQYCFHDQVRQMLDWPDQLHNLKVKIKNGPDDLFYPVAGSEIESWPQIAAMIERYAGEKDPFALSTELDKILCGYLLQNSMFTPFFVMYHKLNFDLENIRSYFRSRNFKNSRDIFEQVFIPYGSLSIRLFLDNFGEPLDILSRAFFTTPYFFLIEKGGLYLEQHQSFLRLERLCDERRLELLKQCRYLTFGIEPLYGYYQMKMAEVRKLRQVYWGKMNEVPPEQLKESIPDVW